MEVHGTDAQINGGPLLQLDTVRALHQTVVSLRDALEHSKSELYDLRKKYESHLDVSVYSDTIKKLTLENHILRRKLIIAESVDGEQDCYIEDTKTDFATDCATKKVTFDLEEEPLSEVSQELLSQIVDEVESETKEEGVINIEVPTLPQISSDKSTTEYSDNTENDSRAVLNSQNLSENAVIVDDCKAEYSQDTPEKNFTSNSKPDTQPGDKKSPKNKSNEDETFNEYEASFELESQFDLRIKVSASNPDGTLQPIEVKTVDSSHISFKSEKQKRKEKKRDLSKRAAVINIPFDGDLVLGENSVVKEFSVSTAEMAGSREGDSNTNDKFCVQVKITSEENLTVDPYSERGSNSEHLNVDQDEISVRSISEGDNSVFSETIGTGAGGTSAGGTRRVCEQDSISGNESEEVDDIELIFTTEETKELSGFQEDLVSITEGESWGGHGETSTPVLLKFNILDAESQSHQNPESNTETDNFENENQENTNLQGILADVDRTHPRKSSLKNPIGDGNVKIQDGANENTSRNKRGYMRSSSTKNYLEAAELKNQNRKSFESNESFSFDNHKSYSFDNTKSSSFDRGSSVDVGTRELSFDQREESFDQFDVSRTTLRTQYSVCVETDISKCGVMEDDYGNLNVRRNTCPNPFQYRPLSHREAVAVRGAVRPLLAAPRGPRRSSAAQTDISALPNHWRSDTHLARKALPLALTTLPGKVCGTGGTRLLPPQPGRPARRTEEARRVLLSDIGFTSMVPELSRSAEPVWGALGGIGGPGGAGGMSGGGPVSAHPPLLCCAAHALPSFGSVPSSPTRHEPSSGNSKYWSRGSMQRSISGRMADTMLSGSHRLSFIDGTLRGGWRGSMPELHGAGVGESCCAWRGRGVVQRALTSGGDSAGSTEDLLDEADRFLRTSIDCLSAARTQDDYWPSRYSRPYLPTGARQLRLGHLVKVIAPHGRIALGKVRYVGIAGGPTAVGGTCTAHVGVQLGTTAPGGGDGSFRGRRYFHCPPGRSIFVPFSKVVMAWADS